MEVIYTGLHQTPEQIVQTVIQEDADAVGLSVLSGAHMTLFAKTMELLRSATSPTWWFGGGIIPDADIPELARLGVAKIFTPARPWRHRRLGTGERGRAGARVTDTHVNGGTALRTADRRWPRLPRGSVRVSSQAIVREVRRPTGSARWRPRRTRRAS